MNYHLRPATDDDYSFCHDLTRQNMDTLVCRHWGGWQDTKFQEDFVAENTVIIIVADQPVGYLSRKFLGQAIYIDNLQIASAHRNRGIGTHFLQSLFDEYSDQTIQLTTFEDNSAKRLYERMGFKIVEKNGFTLTMKKMSRNASDR
ncbi:MAG: GNAT family N-acetyltransferase [Leptolyngbyaceae cyanobacterium]